MKAKILEIFRSIQGEGKYAGVPQVFVRFFECNMHCDWCDTPASIGDASRNYTDMGLDEVMAEIGKLRGGCHSASLTGGEPLMQTPFLKELLPLLKQSGLPAYLETNGTLPAELAEVIRDVDVVAMDLKLPSSTGCRAYWTEHEEFLKISTQKDVFIKAVVTSGADRADIVRAVDLVRRIAPDILFVLQPNTFELKNGVMARCLEFQEYCLKFLPNTRIMPQMHKFMKVR
ncbi:MAG: 7-carboxy-7-deazaguanine synthase QueE [Candidatus Omnitrophota bacterium]|nr:7-carboxy-7-deazaguanine synthase QueE [Candidatus Omnitrophota bacterium]MDZ4241886.1 7-carboxy-7-deazaguanine synthase QueE [Candidatus Omnitrophota bacterium]